MKRRGIVLKIGLILLVALLAGRFAACGLVKKEPGDGGLYKQIELFSDAISYIRANYVEETKSKDLIYGALKGMLASLDPHSQFMDPESFKEIKIETKGEFGGLGIEISIKDGVLTIISPLEDTPAYVAGIKPGDRIVKIDGLSTKNITLLDAVKKLRGKAGSVVTLTIVREEEGRIFDVKVTRAIIKLESIKAAVILEDNIGYIRLGEFQEKTPRDLEKALKKLEKEGMDGLILDLRNNPGGLLDVAVGVSEKFIPKGETIVTIKGRTKDQEIIYKAKANSHPDFPIVVLVNGGSASASEIVAGAIQDNGRGIILGTKTFGKGSVQTVVPLRDGSALRLTTAKYYTPSGRGIRDEGIIPDVVVKYESPHLKDEAEKKKEEIFQKVEEEKPEEIKEKGVPRDNQLLRAIDLLKGIKVYRGHTG